MEILLGTIYEQGTSKSLLGWIGLYSQTMPFILVVILLPPSCPSQVLITGPFPYSGLDPETISVGLSTLKPSG